MEFKTLEQRMKEDNQRLETELNNAKEELKQAQAQLALTEEALNFIIMGE